MDFPDAAVQDQPAVRYKAAEATEENPTALPSWLEAGGEVFARIHADGLWSGTPERNLFAVQRTRLEVGITPIRGFQFRLQGQDSRSLVVAGSGKQRDSFDFNQAYVDVSPGRGWEFRAGRQEMAFGDERLIGTDSEWSYLGQSFDGVRVSHGGERVQLDWFAVAPVSHLQGRWNRPETGVWLHGFHSSFRLPGGRNELDAYFIWKRAGYVQGEGGLNGRGERYTTGFRQTAALPGGLETNIEVALQRGRAAGDRVRAWAGHWEVAKPLGRRESAPRLTVEYNYGSGDTDTGDGVQRQFDDLFPASHDKYGIADPIPWSNMHSAGGSMDWNAGERVRFSAGGRSIWLAAPVTAVHGEPLFPGCDLGHHGRYLGVQASFLATIRPSKQWRIDVGVSHLFAGAALDCETPLTIPFAALRYRF